MGKSITELSSVTRVGLDLAKNVFQVHAVDAKGESSSRARLRAAGSSQFFAKLAAVRGGDGGLLVGASLGAAIAGARLRGEADPAGACEALCPAQQERRGRRGGDLRGGGAAGPAVRAGASIDNQAELMRHRARELLAGQRTSALNALRGHLAEIGVVAPQGAQHAYDLKRLAADGFDDNGEIVVPDCVRAALRPLVGSDRRARRGDRSDRQGARGVGQGRRDRQAADDHSRHRPGHRLGDHGHDPRHERLRQRGASSPPSSA